MWGQHIGLKKGNMYTHYTAYIYKYVLCYSHENILIYMYIDICSTVYDFIKNYSSFAKKYNRCIAINKNTNHIRRHSKKTSSVMGGGGLAKIDVFRRGGGGRGQAKIDVFNFLLPNVTF